MQDFIDAYLAESATALAAFQADPTFRATMTRMGETITAALRAGGKLLIAGNGGSAADAQHIAGEFVSRLFFDRAPMAAIALTVDSSAITATANDYGFERVFERQVLALGQAGDVLLGISTSGRSSNILRGFAAAREKGLVSLGFTGADGGPMRDACSLLLEAPSIKTAIVQQVHITAIHIVCGLVERAMFPEQARALRG
jgi:D-sedoheptulose 7-phosphate isomerase